MMQRLHKPSRLLMLVHSVKLLPSTNFAFHPCRARIRAWFDEQQHSSHYTAVAANETDVISHVNAMAASVEEQQLGVRFCGYQCLYLWLNLKKTICAGVILQHLSRSLVQSVVKANTRFSIHQSVVSIKLFSM
jgi:hypothetical protein